MNPRIASIENLIASDPGGRNVFGLMMSDQLRLAAQSLRLARRVAIVSGFFIPEADSGETDGPPGAKAVGEALKQLGIEVDYLTDRRNAPLFAAIGLKPIIDTKDFLSTAQPTHLLSIERAGRGSDGRYRNMHGVDITDVTDPLDSLFLEATEQGLTTIGIGDGGNEIGMGKVFEEALTNIPNGAAIASTVATDFCIASGVSNWGAYGLVGALSVLCGRDLLPTAAQCTADIELLVSKGGAVDGVTHERTATVDGLEMSHSVRILENIRRQIAPSPFERGEPLTVGVLGYGQSGRAAAALLSANKHTVKISDLGDVTVDRGVTTGGVESGSHSLDFLVDCDAIVASPGVPPDADILAALHSAGIPVMSEIEVAIQIGAPSFIAVTGTIGKRTTVELMQRLFQLSGLTLPIGGNRGLPLSRMILDRDESNQITNSMNRDMDPDANPCGLKPSPGEVDKNVSFAVAVSSFQLETVVHFRPHIAIMLNIDEAHLDRHRSVWEYVRVKSRIFMNQRPDDVLILNFDDTRLRSLSRKHHGRTLFVSALHEVDRGAWLADGEIRLNLDGQTMSLGRCKPRFPENLLSAILAARLNGVSIEQLANAIRTLHTECLLT